MDTSSSNEPLVIHGHLDPFFETGSEGVVWSVVWSGVPGYESLFGLENGDELLIYNADGSVAWQGIVALEYQRRHRPYPFNPALGQQEVLGFWVHGLQENLAPETWANAFFERRPAVAKIQPRSYSRGHRLAQALALLESQGPQQAWTFLEQHDPARRKSLEQNLAHSWSYTCEQQGWALPPTFLATEEDKASAWLTLVALDRAKRALWDPKQVIERVVAERWPTLEAFDAAEQARWLSHRLPHDHVFD